MEKKAVSGVIITLLLMSMSASAFNIQLVKASSSIYIRADGSVDPLSAPIQRDGDLYTLTGNITSGTGGIVIERNNMTLDGAGYTVQGIGSEIGIDLSWRNNVTIKNTEIKGFDNAIWFQGSSKNNIVENSIADNAEHGIMLSDSSNNIISENNITANSYDGINLSLSSNNDIFRNNITANARFGIYLYNSSRSNMYGNNIKNNYNGIYFEYFSNYNVVFGNNITDNDVYGVKLALLCKDNVIFNNNMAENNFGVMVYAVSESNKIFGNSIANNEYGIFEEQSSNDFFYHNNLLNNMIQARFDLPNVLDDGYPSGGNYWSDYTGVDLYHGPYQNETGSDGIGDMPYIIAHPIDNRDNYPLMNPWAPSIQEFWVPLVFSQGWGGDFSHGIRVYAFEDSEFTINEASVTLSAGQSYELSNPSIGAHIVVFKGSVMVLYTWLNNDFGAWDDDMVGYTVLPFSGLRKEYLIPIGGAVSVVATQSSTSVDYSGGNHLLANAGDSFQFTSPDGSWISADKPIAVAVGNIDVATESDTYAYAPLPNNLIGISYHFGKRVPVDPFFANQVDLSKIVVMAAEEGTIVSVNGAAQPPLPSKGVLTINAPSDGTIITSDKPVSVVYLQRIKYADPWTGHTRYSSYAYSLVPKSMWGTKYWVMGVLKTHLITEETVNVQIGSNPTQQFAPGEYDLGSLSAGTNITSDKPIALEQIDASDWSGIRYHARGPAYEAFPEEFYKKRVHDIATTRITTAKTIVGQSVSMQIDVTVANQGDFSEAFRVTVYANATYITSQPAALLGGKSIDITFSWNTTDFPYGNYTISAHATLVSEETFTDNNTMIDGQVVVTILGDANGDRKVDTLDISDLSKTYGFAPHVPNWNPNCDINGDGKVDVEDLYIVGRNHGRTDL